MNIPVKLLKQYENDNPLPVEKIAHRLMEIKSKRAAELDSPEKFLKRKSMLAAVANEDFEDAFERYLETTISYLLIICRSDSSGARP